MSDSGEPTPSHAAPRFSRKQAFSVDTKRAVYEAAASLKGRALGLWLTDVLERVVSGRTKAHELERLLPWAWKGEWLAVAVNS
jgi:hypothetical protein